MSLVGVLAMGAALGAFFLTSEAPPERVVEVIPVVAEPPPPVVAEPPPPVVAEPPPPVVAEPPPPVIVEPGVVEPPAKPLFRLGEPDPALRYRVSLEGANFRGAKDAPITLVVFYDFECPFCQRVKGSLAEVSAHYKEDVRIAYMHQPLGFHENAMPAAKAAEAAAAQGKFLQMYELMSENPKELTSANFAKWAREIGLNKKRFDQVFEDPATERRIKSQQAEAIRLGARGIPAYFINGRFLKGALPFSEFQTVIDEELQIANKRIAEGTPRGAVYETLMKEALPDVK